MWPAAGSANATGRPPAPRGPKGTGLPVPLLATAPALFQPLHEPRFSARPGAPVLAGRPCRALAPRTTGAAARARGAPGHGTAHVTPAPQRPQGAAEHDHNAADTHKNDLGTHTGQQQAHSEQEPDRSIDRPPLVVDLRVSCPHGLRKLRIVGIERLLDLLELTLLVLRKRHSASHEPHARGQVR